MNLPPVKCGTIVLFVFILLSGSKTFAESLEPASFPSLISSINVTIPLEFCNEAVPTESQEIRGRLEKELLLILWNRPQVILWLKRSTRYFPIIEDMLRETGMPDDLKYVAIAESALRPHATSRKGAVGFWQFIERTGGKYGLDINRRIDERRSILASTRAAIRYFRNLYEIFASWTLAAAVYNMGEERLTADILKQGTNNDYDASMLTDPPRLVGDLFGVQSTEVKDTLKLNGSLVEQVRIGVHPDRVRVVFDLVAIPKPEIPYHVFSSDDRLVVSFKVSSN